MMFEIPPAPVGLRSSRTCATEINELNVKTFAFQSGMDSSSPDLNAWDTHAGDCATPGRKVRLFKTRAETNKRNLANKKQDACEAELSRPSEALNVPRPRLREEARRQSTNADKERIGRLEANGLKRSASHEVISSRKNLSTPEFQVGKKLGFSLSVKTCLQLMM